MVTDSFAAAFECRVASLVAEALAGQVGGRGQAHLVCAAVSGGPDSMALLHALFKASPNAGFSVEAITVDHGIRAPEESSGDARFVAEYCLRRGIPCRVITLAAGLVAQTAKERGKGIEEAARHLRYAALSEAARESGGGAATALVCLGHNRNDRLETLVQRFLQGGATSGMQARRGVFFRPLLDVSRDDIERYLSACALPFRIDATNADTRYLRNSLRHTLLPVLDSVYPGWRRGVLRHAEQAALDSEALEALVPEAFWTSRSGDNALTGDSTLFLSLHTAIRLRLLSKALVLLGAVGAAAPLRIPRALLLQAAEGKAASGCGVRIWYCSGEILAELLAVQKDIAYTKKIGYFCLVREAAAVRIPGGEIYVGDADAAGLTIGPVTLPLVIRSRREGDAVQTADGGRRTLKSIYAGWRVPPEMRSAIPLVEEAEGIRCVWGAVAGFPDWVVAGASTPTTGTGSVYLTFRSVWEEGEEKGRKKERKRR